MNESINWHPVSVQIVVYGKCLVTMIFGGEIPTYEAYSSGKSLCEKLLEFNPLSVAKALFEPLKMRLEV